MINFDPVPCMTKADYDRYERENGRPFTIWPIDHTRDRTVKIAGTDESFSARSLTAIT